MSGFARSEVRQHNGVPTLFIDNEPNHAMTATSVSFDDEQVIRDFVNAGVEIMMIWIEVALKCWKGPGEYDWSYAEEKLAFFEEHSGSTKWLIRIRLGLVAPWWGEAHPSEVHANQPTMSVCNIASPIWRADVEQVLTDFVGWLQTTRYANRIAGFMVNAGATEEWLIFDTDKTTAGHYHEVYTREFRGWLAKKYGNDQALRTSWGDDAVTLATAGCPTGMGRRGSHIWGPFALRDPGIDRRSIDYYYFLNETLADALISFCRTVKTAAATPTVCGGFHSYLWWETGVYSYIQEYGHGLIQRLNESPWIDFVSDIASYDCRYPGGPSGYLGLPHSLNLHGKLHYTEVDLNTTTCMPHKYLDAWATGDQSLVKPGSAEPLIPDRFWKWSGGYCGRDETEQVAIFQREHMHNLVTGTPYWWFDIRDHNYHASAFVSALNKLSTIGKQAVSWDRRSLSEVAFIVSEDTPMYQSAMSGALIRFEMESAHGLLNDVANRKWGLAGVPVDYYEVKDLNHPDFHGDQYKLMVFLNASFVSDEIAAGIRRWQSGGRTMLWTFAAGVLDEERFDVSIGADLIGMKLGCKMARRNIHVCVDDTGDMLTTGGPALDFGTEGSVGPVFFVDDASATPLGHLRDGGEVGFALREHSDWNSIYLSMTNFGPSLLRNVARYAGAHIWCDSDDVIYANQSIVVLHTAGAGTKTIRLPGPAVVTDLWTGERSPNPVDVIEASEEAYRTRAWRTEYAS
ncbi:MAG TPA: hypothetical protein VGK19_17050 [Capsulimonadaceae bacterium]|jgi:hypothetical protein